MGEGRATDSVWKGQGRRVQTDWRCWWERGQGTDHWARRAAGEEATGLSSSSLW